MSSSRVDEYMQNEVLKTVLGITDVNHYFIILWETEFSLQAALLVSYRRLCLGFNVLWLLLFDFVFCK